MGKIIVATIYTNHNCPSDCCFAVKFNDMECNAKYGRGWLHDWDECHAVVDKARKDGYNIIVMEMT